MQDGMNWVRFGFPTEHEALLFRARAFEVVGVLVAPGELPDEARPMTGHLGKPVLIVARTDMEAVEHAMEHGLVSGNWRFVAHAHALFGASPETHQLVFAGEWRERKDVAVIRERAKGQGFNVPR